MPDRVNEIVALLARLDADVLDMLREDLPVQRAEISSSLEVGELPQARDLVHGVNGTAAFCQLHELRSAASALEAQLDRGDFDERIAGELLREIERTLSALDQMATTKE